MGKPFQNKWVKTGISVIYIFLAASMIIAFFMPAGQSRRIMKLISNYWLGILLYMVLIILPVTFIRVVVRMVQKHRNKKKNLPVKLYSRRNMALGGAICAVIIGTVSIGGMINARIIHVTPYDISIDKSGGKLDSLKVVLVADLHLGYNIGIQHMTKMVEKINDQDPDLVVIAGDIFDNEYEAVEKPEKMEEIFQGIKSKYGVYACYGNHDIEEPILAGFTFSSDEKKESSEKMDEFLEKSNIRLLKDEKILIDDSVWLYGRPDMERPNRGIDVRKTPEEITEGLDTRKPVIVIDHEPAELQQLSDAGVDVDLCGHTHDGQLFPGNLTIKLMWENAYGYLKKGKMHNIVTSGTGLFGPYMRIGTRAEICPVTIRFRNS
ncbi:MAG: metallophosphoesterase [Blautia sp.]|nr:metallophosphoesterase [Blautia sp.]